MTRTLRIWLWTALLVTLVIVTVRVLTAQQTGTLDTSGLATTTTSRLYLEGTLPWYAYDAQGLNLDDKPSVTCIGWDYTKKEAFGCKAIDWTRYIVFQGKTYEVSRVDLYNVLGPWLKTRTPVPAKK